VASSAGTKVPRPAWSHKPGVVSFYYRVHTGTGRPSSHSPSFGQRGARRWARTDWYYRRSVAVL